MMLLRSCCMVLFLSGVLLAGTDISIKGKVSDGSTGIAGAELMLKNYPTIKTTTSDSGTFELRGSLETGTGRPFILSTGSKTQFEINGCWIQIIVGSGIQNGAVSIFTGNGRTVYNAPRIDIASGTHRIDISEYATGLYLLRVTLDRLTLHGTLIVAGNDRHLTMESDSKYPLQRIQNGTAAAALDSLVVEKSGFKRKCVALESYTIDEVTVLLEKEGGTTLICSPVKLPSVSELEANQKLPDPFKYIDGTRISRKADWPCLRKNLMALLSYSHGDLPEDPGKVSATYASGELNISVTVGSKTESFKVKIKAPSGTGPHPAIITLGGSTITIPNGIGEISYPHNTVANEKSRTGVFSSLYGSNTTAGSMVMWAWGVGRIIDALETTTGHNIDPERLGVTGCSRNGKGAMVCGAYEERIALTLPMEGGSGGISSWRIAKVENPNKSAHPDGCQTASQIVGESGWLSPQFNQFATGSVGLDKLPTDAHTLAALCAPRGLFFVEGSKNSWNCNVCCWTAASAARMVYEALGYTSNIGIVMTDHNHCSGYSSAESTAWNAFCKRFLLGDEQTETDYFTKDGKFDDLIDFDTWIDWEMPILE